MTDRPTEQQIVEIGARALQAAEGAEGDQFMGDYRRLSAAYFAALREAGLVLEQGWRFDMENAPEYVDLLVKGPPYTRNENGIWVAVKTKYGWQGCAWGMGRDFRPDDAPTAWRPLPTPPATGDET